MNATNAAGEAVLPSGGAAARMTLPVLQGAVVAALGGLLFGFDSAVIGGAEQRLKEFYHLSGALHGFTVASALIGTVAGSLAAGFPADRWGRRRTLFGIAFLYLVTSLGCALASSWAIFVSFRLLGGLAIGGASVVAPMYIAEIAPSSLRGRLVAVQQLNVVAGILLSGVSNYFVARWTASASGAPDPDAWRWMLGAVAAPSALFLVLLCGIAESPRWLVRAGRRGEARAVLARLGDPDAEAELDRIAATLRGEASREHLFQARYLRPIGLVVAMAAFNQLSGINALMYYTPRIFGMAGADASHALAQSVAVFGTNFAFTVLALFAIDRFGRRPLMIAGSLGLVASLSAVAWEFSLGPAADGRIVLASLLAYIACFAFSQGAVIWVFISEVFPNAVRAKGQALGSFTHWAMAALVGQLFPAVAERTGAGAFGFFAAMMFLQLLFAWRILPETRGGTLEDVESRLARRSR